METTAITNGSVISADGTTIGYHVLGKGPGLLVIHGGWRHGLHYRKMAELFSPQFTVYLMDRRGRGLSGPQGENYSLEKELDDALAIVQHENIQFIFGHSFGGMVAAHLALRHSFLKIALYEPGIFGNLSFPVDWIPEFEQQLARREMTRAMLTFTKGLEMAGPLENIPGFLLRPLFWLIGTVKGRKETNQLLRQLPGELRILRQPKDIAPFAALQAPVLLLTGTESPAYFDAPMKNLAETLPHAELVKMEKVGHNAPDEEDPDATGAALLRFFSEKSTPAA